MFRRSKDSKPQQTAIRHLMWDWNGTLLNDAENCAVAVDAMKIRRGLIGESLEAYKDKVMFPVSTYYKTIGFDLGEENFSELCNEFIATYRLAAQGIVPEGSTSRSVAAAQLHSDVMEVLNFAGGAGLTHSIVSASEKEALKEQVSLYGLSNQFVSLVGRDDNHGGMKDHLVREWVSECGYARDQILYIGDTEHDCEAASSAGIRAVLVSDGHVSEKRLRRLRVPVFKNRKSLWQEISEMTTAPEYRSFKFDTEIGLMSVVTDNLGLVHADLPGADPWLGPKGVHLSAGDELTLQAAKTLSEWLKNPSGLPDIAASVFGTAFQRSVWKAVCEIPFGQTMSYGQLALQIGLPKGARAVAQALKSNPVPLHTPCHRVIGSNGKPRGFMGTINHPMQKQLIDMESNSL